METVFVSYTKADRAWAEWIAWILSEANYSVNLQAWDFRPGDNFILAMHKAASLSDRTIAVMSPDYLNSLYTMAEWAAAFASDPDGTKRKLVHVIVRETTLTGLMIPIVHINLVALEEATAREKLLNGLTRDTIRPEIVRFPGGERLSVGLGAPSVQEPARSGLAALPLEEVPEPGPLPKGSWMPLNPNLLFVGRAKALKALARQFKVGEMSETVPVKIAAITGLGGIGKTQLASEFVYRYGRFFAGGVFWLSFADPENIEVEIADCGRNLGLSASFEALSLESQVRLVKEAWESPLPRLLVFDSCEDEALLKRWCPHFGGARVLVTGQGPRGDLSLGTETIVLSTLSRDASVDLLHRFRPDVPEAEPAFDQIAENLGDLPLALHLAGSFLKRYRFEDFAQPANYLRTLEEPRNPLDGPALQGWGSGALPTDHEADVGRTFTLSFGRLNPANNVDALAAEFLARAAWFALGEPIPRFLLIKTTRMNLQNLTSTLRAADALLRLIGLGFLTTDNQNDLNMHLLVAFWARRLARSEEARNAVEEAVLSEARRLNGIGNPTLLQAWQSHLQKITDRASQREDRMTAQLCTELGIHLRQTAQYSRAQPYLERALRLHEKLSGAKHPDTAESRENLGRLLHRQGEYGKAQSYYKEALAIREEVFGEMHPDTARSLNDLGRVLSAQGQFEEARRQHERALEIRIKALGMDHPETADSLNNLGGVLQDLKDYQGALLFFDRALTIKKKVLGPAHPDTGRSLNNIGGLLRDLKSYEEALPFLQRALAIEEKVLGHEHPDTATSLNNLGGFFHEQRCFSEARSYYDRALAIREKILGEHHLDTGWSLLNLGTLDLKEKHEDSARHNLKRAIVIFEERLGLNHKITKDARKRLRCLSGPYRSKKSSPKPKKQ